MVVLCKCHSPYMGHDGSQTEHCGTISHVVEDCPMTGIPGGRQTPYSLVVAKGDDWQSVPPIGV